MYPQSRLDDANRGYLISDHIELTQGSAPEEILELESLAEVPELICRLVTS
jgi:hypothetical protein